MNDPYIQELNDIAFFIFIFYIKNDQLLYVNPDRSNHRHVNLLLIFPTSGYSTVASGVQGPAFRISTQQKLKLFLHI